MLLTDIFFPNAMAAWRLNEVGAFMEHFDTDIMVVTRTNAFESTQLRRLEGVRSPGTLWKNLWAFTGTTS